MSYDLFFCKRQGTKFKPQEVLSWCSRLPGFQMPSASEVFQIWYQNEETGVYFSLDCAYSKAHHGEENFIPSDFVDCGLSFNLNYARPSFFAVEALPLVVQMAQDLDLLVVDPQDHEIRGKGLPKKAKEDELIMTWERANLFAIRALADKGTKSLYLPKEKSLAWWNYMKARGEIQEQLGKGIFVPSISIVKEKLAGRLKFAITWLVGLPTLLPPCDLIILGEDQGDGSKILGWAPFTTILEKIEPYLEPFDKGVPGTKILAPRYCEQASERLHPLSLKGDFSSVFEGISPDGFVDMAP